MRGHWADSRLFQGHLVLDVDVPSMLLDQCSIRDELEFTKMRYTAVTCDPNDFVVRQGTDMETLLTVRTTGILSDRSCMTLLGRLSCLL